MSNNEYTKRLENVIKQMLQPLKDIPFNLVIESMTGKKVISFDFATQPNLREKIQFCSNLVIFS
jgi:hypothetical protein